MNMPSIKQRATLTEKQEKVLAGIEARVLGPQGMLEDLE